MALKTISVPNLTKLEWHNTSRYLIDLIRSPLFRRLMVIVKARPILGSPLVDALILYATGMRESRFKSGTIKNPHGTALGYFQIIKATRNAIAKKHGLRWDDTLETQAKFAASLYNDILQTLKRDRSRVKTLVDNNRIINTVANLLWRYGGGWGKYAMYPDALTAHTKVANFYPPMLLADVWQAKNLIKGDVPVEVDPESGKRNALDSLIAGRTIIFPTPALKNEFVTMLDPTVKAGFIALADSVLGDCRLEVTSIRTSFDGSVRTEENGPNHIDGGAIDFVIRDPRAQGIHTYNEFGDKRSPNYDWNKSLISSLYHWNQEGLNPGVAVVLEPDHIHVDAARTPGVYTYRARDLPYSNYAPGFDTGLTLITRDPRLG